MQAIVLKQFGDESVLELDNNYPKPSLLDNELMIKLQYASVNPIDYKIRQGLSWGADAIKDKLPWVLGFDFAGTVIDSYNTKNNHLLNKRVCGTANMLENGGSYAQYASVDISKISIIPNSIDSKIASALPLAGMTAYQALDIIKCTKGSKVLILAGAGGVGHIAVQLAVLRGLLVDTTASSYNHSLLKKLGANPIDYHNQSLKANYYDGIIDLVGDETTISALKQDGILLSVPTISADKIINTAKKNNKKALGMLYKSQISQLDEMLGLLHDKKLDITIDSCFSLTDIKKAHLLSQKGHISGKIVLKIC